VVRSVVAGSLLTVLMTASARAEAADAHANEPPLAPALVEVGVGGFARYDLGDFCEADGDVVSCTSGRAFVGAELAPRLRLSRLVSLGVFGSFGWAPGSESNVSSDGSHEDRSLTAWRLEAEGRLHPLADEDIDLWLGADVGVSAVRDAWDVYGPGDRIIETRADTEVAPVLGAAVGIDFRVAEIFALGPELRGALHFDGNASTLSVSLGVTGTFLVAD
jgi:hypothetical protein